MNKRIIVLLLLSFAVVIVFYCYNNSYSEFEPIVFKNGVYTKIEVDANFYKNLKTVLDYSDVSYKVNRVGNLRVKRKVKTNKELIWNYTTKALDTGWVKSHISN